MTSAQYCKAMAALNLTRDQAAKLLGYNERTIRRWVNGTSPIPKSVELYLGALIIGNAIKGVE